MAQTPERIVLTIHRGSGHERETVRFGPAKIVNRTTDYSKPLFESAGFWADDRTNWYGLNHGHQEVIDELRVLAFVREHQMEQATELVFKFFVEESETDSEILAPAELAVSADASWRSIANAFAAAVVFLDIQYPRPTGTVLASQRYEVLCVIQSSRREPPREPTRFFQPITGTARLELVTWYDGRDHLTNSTVVFRGQRGELLKTRPGFGEQAVVLIVDFPEASPHNIWELYTTHSFLKIGAQSIRQAAEEAIRRHAV